MKKFFVIFILYTLSIQVAFALCPNGSISIWPRSDTININPVIMIEAYAYPRMILEQVKFGTAKFYLQSDKETIQLESIEFCKGDVSLMQGIFKPKYALKKGDKYKIIIKGAMPWVKKRFEEKWSKTWVVDIIHSKLSLLAHEQFRVSDFYYNDEFGCGTVSGFSITAPLKETDGSFFVRISVRSVEGKSYENIYYERMYGDKFSIGTEMCSGAFELPLQTKFVADISFLDEQGKSIENRSLHFQTF